MCSQATVALASLPAELILAVTRHLSTSHALALARTSRHFNAIVTDFVYERHVQYSAGPSFPLWWAVIHKSPALARRALEAGVDPEDLVGYERSHYEQPDASPLWLATHNNDLPVVKILLEHGADPSAMRKESPLMLAAQMGYVDIARALLDTAQEAYRGPQRVSKGPWFINARDNRGHTALHIAAAAGHAEVCHLLLAKGARLEARDSFGQTPLHRAVCSSSLATVKALLAGGADPLLTDYALRSSYGNRPDRGECNALDLAIDALGAGMNLDTKTGILESLVLNVQRETADGRKWLPLSQLQAYGLLTSSSVAVAGTLLQHGLQPDPRDSSGCTPLIAIAGLYNTNPGKEPRIRDLLSAGADVNAAGEGRTTALMKAARSGSSEVVELLLFHGASLTATDCDGMSPVAHAAVGGNLNTAETLFRHLHASRCGLRAEADHEPRKMRDGRIPKGSPQRYCPAITEQLEAEVHDDEFSEGATPLMLAIRHKRQNAAELFMSNGASIDVVTNTGVTTLGLAASVGILDLARRLLEYGISPDVRDDLGTSPLMHAASCGNLDMVKLLIQHGADVHMGNEMIVEDLETPVETPFLLAARAGSCQTVSYLIEAGVDPKSQIELDPELIPDCYRRHWKDMIQLLTDILHLNTSEIMTTEPALSREAVSLASLPHELVLYIARHLSTTEALSLAQTCRHLNIVTDFAYKRHIRHARRADLPLWNATIRKNTALARRALAAGADPNARIAVTSTSETGIFEDMIPPLCVAVDKNDPEMVKLLLDHGADPCAAYRDMERVLMRAAGAGHIDICHALLAAASGTKPGEPAARIPWFVDVRDRKGQTALHLAAGTGHTEICDILLEHGARLEARCLSGLTPLYQAVAGGMLVTVVFLLNAGADPLLIDSSDVYFSGNVLDKAAAAVGVETVVPIDAQIAVLEAVISTIQGTIIEKRRAPIDEQQAHHLLRASDYRAARVLLRGGLHVDARHQASGITPLLAAIASRENDAAKILRIRDLVDFGADVNAAGFPAGTTALMAAARWATLEVAELLLSRGASLFATDHNGVTVLASAGMSANPDTVEALLGRIHEARCGSNADHEPPSYTADQIPQRRGVGQGHCPAIAEQLGLRNHDRGQTPLMMAVLYGTRMTVDLFLANGADIHATDASGREALAIAAEEDKAPIVAHLVERGADIDRRDGRGRTPLMHAAAASALLAVQVLIDHGADVHAVNEVPSAVGGPAVETPFILAVWGGRIDIARKLVEAGVDIAAQLALEPGLQSTGVHNPKMKLFLEGKVESEVKSDYDDMDLEGYLRDMF
ncbi:ankyrin repeat-containing domain protein [Microdochium bolleyi]|uniref:Ankyrin repeat-containing domain protein n=1 Tax=Microdochium bolleyi TaxID=196109 RepID=A0A136IRG2_9PEZI|nr:ankyrin repeat-containing domain protein [Microdochium bolleyi]